MLRIDVIELDSCLSSDVPTLIANPVQVQSLLLDPVLIHDHLKLPE